MSNFVHTHRHGEFSLLDGVGTAQQWAEQAVLLNQPAIANTDHGTLSGSLHHYQACKDAGVVPIMGCELYFRPNRLQHDNENKTYYHMVLLAKDLKGWHNLIRLTSEAYKEESFYYKPCVDFELLSRHTEGLICTTACLSSYLNKSIMKGDDREVFNTIRTLRKLYGDDLFIEIMPHDIEDQRQLNIELVNLANHEGIPVVATVDAHYPYADWADTQDVVLMMATGQTHEKRKQKRERGEDVYQFDCDTLYLMGREEVDAAFDRWHPDLPASTITQAMDNTMEILNRTVPFLMSKRQKMPKVEGDSYQTLREWIQGGLEEKGFADNQVYIDRCEYELSILKEQDVLDYFIIVGDLCRWARDQGIRLGAGRGSAAGCLVSYLIGITQIDPIPNGLLFERFMNPERKGMPDIDLDFQSDRREEVKTYLGQKWGVDKVADVCSHQTYKPRAAIQKISMVFDVPYQKAHKVTDTIDPMTDLTLEQLRLGNQTLDEFSNDFPEVWRHALRVEGQVHTLSKHAGGVVITDKPIAEYMPTMRKDKGATMTAWGDRADFPIISNYGFMKIDVLGIKGLGKQEYACDLIFKRTGERINLNDLGVCRDPYDVQPEVMQAFSDGMTLGVWQFSGSQGFNRLIRSIKPTWLGDLGAANAIYRPGPLAGEVNLKYAAAKSGAVPVESVHPLADPTLVPTYGLILYQEQIMELAKTMANFTGGQADDLRKAIGKEYRRGMAHVIQFLKDKGHEERWADGCAANDIPKVVADEVWRLFLGFGGYGFNKSHAYAYAIQSYQDMWLKVNYPLEFYAAHLTYDPDDARKVIREARIFDVAVLPPDINDSGFGFAVTEDGIRFGLKAIKNVGDVAVRKILSNQPFRSMDDFETRMENVKPKLCNKRVKEALVACGAFDRFGARDSWHHEDRDAGEADNLGGINLSQARVLTLYKNLVKSRIPSVEDWNNGAEGEGYMVGGEISHVKQIITRGGKDMAFITITFYGQSWDVTIFPDTFDEFKDLIKEGGAVMVRGRKNLRTGSHGRDTLLADVMCSVEELAMTVDQGD